MSVELCANPATAMLIPFWLFWLCLAIAFGAGAAVAFLAGRDNRRNLVTAYELLGKVLTATKDPSAWRMPRRLQREIADFLGVP